MEGEDYNNSYDYHYDYEYPEDPEAILISEEFPPLEGGAIRIFLVAVYSVICCLGILGNGLVIFIATFKVKKTVNTIWFVNLAIADFLFNLFLPFHIAYVAADYHWVFGTAMCKVSNFLLNHNMHTSVFLLMAISFDRCIAVLLPVWSQNHRSIRLVYVACVVIWVLASLLSFPSLVFRDTVLVHGKIACFSNFSLAEANSSLGPARLHPGSVGFRWHLAVSVMRFLCGFLIPVLIITACYVTIVCKLRRNRLAKTKKPFKIILTIIITFFLCWCPYQTLYLLELHHTSVPASVFTLGLPLATVLAIANSCMNPILYAFMGQDFKKFRVNFFSRLANALSEDTGQYPDPSHRNSTRMSSINERSSKNEKETNML
ncbi:chemerin-like receptor 1 [Myotis yumanensis]|uniref:chemerin-like receptor 1 n=1 Tax=Myotis yumanensis TaxID=159337 RepID=UPI0038D38B17